MKIMLPMSLCALYLVCSVHRYRAPHLLNSRTPTRLGTSAVIQPDTGTIQAKQAETHQGLLYTCTGAAKGGSALHCTLKLWHSF